MNYEEQVRAMVEHASQASDSDEFTTRLGEVVRACGIGIAVVAVGLPKELIEEFLASVSKAIAAETLVYQAKKSAGVMDPETFLREHFNPGVFHG